MRKQGSNSSSTVLKTKFWKNTLLAVLALSLDVGDVDDVALLLV